MCTQQNTHNLHEFFCVWIPAGWTVENRFVSSKIRLKHRRLNMLHELGSLGWDWNTRNNAHNLDEMSFKFHGTIWLDSIRLERHHLTLRTFQLLSGITSGNKESRKPYTKKMLTYVCKIR